MKVNKLKKQQRTRMKMKRLDKPRLSVFRSNMHIYAQVIDNKNGQVLASASEKNLAEKSKNKIEVAKAVGVEIAKAAKEKKISDVIFDRGAYRYHGRIKALAEGAREGGLKF